MQPKFLYCAISIALQSNYKLKIIGVAVGVNTKTLSFLAGGTLVFLVVIFLGVFILSDTSPQQNADDTVLDAEHPSVTSIDKNIDANPITVNTSDTTNSENSSTSSPSIPEDEYVHGELLVIYKNNISSTEISMFEVENKLTLL